MTNHTSNYLNHCIFGCEHDRHQPYKDKFVKANVELYERQYYWQLAKFVMDPNISSSNADDLEMFQDIVFESPWGRIHIHFYEQLFKNYYRYQQDWTIEAFCRYCLFLDAVSILFLNDAYDFIFRKNDNKIILQLLKEMPFELKMKFIKAAEKYPETIQSVPKLKLYNLFS